MACVHFAFVYPTRIFIIWIEEGIESQAIDRCNRIGQKKPVHVYQLVAENTVEAKVCPPAIMIFQ